jgi:hypothetical protein
VAPAVAPTHFLAYVWRPFSSFSLALYWALCFQFLLADQHGYGFLTAYLSAFKEFYTSISVGSTWLSFAKFFGSGVIVSVAQDQGFMNTQRRYPHQIATAFIHLLGPGIEELGSECLAEQWGDYVCHCCNGIYIPVLCSICFGSPTLSPSRF